MNAMVEAILGYSFMSAVKAMIGEREGDPAWRVMRPPLDPLTPAQTRKLAGTLASIRANGAVKAA